MKRVMNRDKCLERICCTRIQFRPLRVLFQRKVSLVCIGIVLFVISLFSGIGANLIGIFPVQALKLASNDLFRDWLSDENGHVSLFRGMLAGAGAGCVQVIASNPMEITKIRLQIQSSLPVAERKNIGGGMNESVF